MPKTYALLKNPAHTRVSFQDSDTLAIKELSVFANLLHATNIRTAQIGGVTYILFDCDNEITPAAVQMLSRMSFVYAIFRYQLDSLVPVTISPNFYLAPELSTILKYTGKTNELFTRMMLNLVLLQINNLSESLNILDPLAGKGTTLYESLILGHNAYGVEVDSKPAHESAVYLKKYLETAKLKHTTHTEKISGVGDGRKFTSTRHQISVTRTKGESARQYEMLDGDTRYMPTFFRKNFFHAIVADLPYGVQHGSKAGSKGIKKTQGGSITRNALGLVKESLPGWVRVLKPGGVIALAWNLFLISRAEMAELLMASGFKVVDFGECFAHRVDQAIDRDVIVGVHTLS